jgi:hypothetical protein
LLTAAVLSPAGAWHPAAVSTPAAAPDRRDTVFVSYAHEDAEWVQRLQILLKPLVRSRKLRVWTDSGLSTGADWDREICAAIAHIGLALLLVSADFLDSDYILERELPALLEHGVRLAPVPVGDCLWQHVPELARVQWLHGPDEERALGLLADRPGERDRVLRLLCERLVDLVPAATVTELGPGGGAALPRPVRELEPGSALGPLHGVPALPPGYLLRDELADLVDAVVRAETGAVGLSGRAPAVGLHGQGGIGKSVLAAALTRDPRIRRRFPDGVHWITLGERADVLAAQLDLLDALGSRERRPRTLVAAQLQLTEVMRERRVLLVVDDVWSDAAAEAFRVTGPVGRTLYTTRDPQVLRAVDARITEIDVLSPPAALALAASVLGTTADALPPAAGRALAVVGRVALAVSLLAAAVRGGASWERVADAVDRQEEIFGEHPYATTFKAIQVAVDPLPAELADALLDLAVFPPDTEVPIQAVARYWAHTRGCSVDETLRDLRTLAAANLLRINGDGIGFHDLQHDYLLLHAPALSLLHAGLLDAYRALLPDRHRDEWWRLPAAEPYIFDHLATHLQRAGLRHELVRTTTYPAFVALRIASGGAHSAENDLVLAARGRAQRPRPRLVAGLGGAHKPPAPPHRRPGSTRADLPHLAGRGPHPPREYRHRPAHPAADRPSPAGPVGHDRLVGLAAARADRTHRRSPGPRVVTGQPHAGQRRRRRAGPAVGHQNRPNQRAAAARCRRRDGVLAVGPTLGARRRRGPDRALGGGERPSPPHHAGP